MWQILLLKKSEQTLLTNFIVKFFRFLLLKNVENFIVKKSEQTLLTNFIVKKLN